MSYSKLKQDVTDWSHRTDLATQMDTFAQLTEAVLNKDLRVMEQEVNIDMTFTDAFTDLPSDFLQTRDFYIDIQGRRVSLEQLSPQDLNHRYSKTTGSPRGYSIHGGQIEVRPAPSLTSPATGKWSYYQRIPSLVSNSTNDILDNYPLLYLSGMLVQVNNFLQDNEELVKWSSIFNEQVRTANKSASTGRYTRPSVRRA